MQPRTRKPFVNVSNTTQHNQRKKAENNSVILQPSYANTKANKQKCKSHLPNAHNTNDMLSKPFRNVLNISSKQQKYLLNKPPKRVNEDCDLKKQLPFHSKSISPDIHTLNTTLTQPHTPNLINKKQTLTLNKHNTNTHSHSNSNSLTCTPSQSGSTSSRSMSMSPGVIKNKANIPSPQRIQSISLRSFHTLHHIEFYKPIPIGQSRTTQFELFNETYDDKSINIQQKHIRTNNNTYQSYQSCLTISPSAIALKRNEKCIISVTCQPINAMRIKEVIRIEWDLHNIEVHIHCVGFVKSFRNKNHKSHNNRHRKRTFTNMRNEDSEKCKTVQSSLDSSRSSSNSSKNSINHRRRKSRRPMLSPTIRREKAFTAAPFASPAPNRTRKNFIFNNRSEIDELSVVNEEIALTPNEYKKRRVIDRERDEQKRRLFLENESKNKEIQEFEQLCAAVTPIQALIRCYLAQKKCKQLLFNKKMEDRKQYYFGVLRSQLITKRVRNMYLNYKNAANILQSTIKTYCIQKKCNAYILEQQMRIKREKEERLGQYLQSMIHCKRMRNQFLHIRHSVILLQSSFKTYFAKKALIQTQNKVILIQSYIRTSLHRYKYLHFLQQIKFEKEQQKKRCVLGVLSLWRLQQFRTVINNEKRKYITMTNNASLYIQVWFKGAMQRRKYVTYVHQKRLNNAATYIQLWFRAAMFRRQYIQYRKHVIRKNIAAVYIQSWFKTVMYRRRYIQHKRQQIQRRNAAAMYIQRWFKSALYRNNFIAYQHRKRQNNCAKYIQLWLRAAVQRRKYILYKYQQRQRRNAAALYIQRWFKGSIQRKHFIAYQHRQYQTRLNNSAKYMQLWFRGSMYRRKFVEYKHKQMQRRNAAVLYIQSWYKGTVYRNNFMQLRYEKRVIFIQLWFRAAMHRRQYISYQRQRRNSAATYIQLWFKGVIYRKNFIIALSQIQKQRQYQRQLNNAAKYIQLWFRAALYRKQYILYKHRQMQRRIAAAMYIQLWFRGIKYRKRYISYQWHRRNNAVLYIQKWFKGVRYRKGYIEYKRTKLQNELNNAAKCIQTWFRAVKYRQRYIYYKRTQWQRQTNAAMYIQKWYKSAVYRARFIQFQKYKQKRECVSNVISLWRLHKFRDCVLAKRRFLTIRKNASQYIQKWFRGAMYRREYVIYKRKQTRNRAAKYIQSWFKGSMHVLHFNKYKQKRQCVLRVVSLWRLSQFREVIIEKRKYFRLQMRAAMFIQTWFKSVMYRRQYIQYCETRKDGYTKKVRLCQALMRGKLLRMNCSNQTMLKRVRNANANWKVQNTVNYLLESALSNLTKARTLYGVSESCETLENLLKIVPNIDKRIVEHNIIGSLYNILRNSNRSVPHLNLIQKILKFFLFFAQYNWQCYKAIFYRNDTLDILSERLQIHRLDFNLFELTTQLFFIGVNTNNGNENNNTFLINLRQSSDINRQIRTVQKIMVSKLEIAKRVNKPLREIKNANANAKYKLKFQQEQTLAKCVANMNNLVDKL